MQQVPVSQTVYARVDDDAHRVVSLFKWCTNSSGYAQRTSIPRIVMHRFIWESLVGEIPEGRVVDHINGDRLDNRLENLRLATIQENNRNAKARTQYKGVNQASDGTWTAKVYTGNVRENSTQPFVYPDGRVGQWRPLKGDPKHQVLYINGKRVTVYKDCYSMRPRYTRKFVQERGFQTAEEAGRAYDRLAWQLFGRFAKLNFPQE